MDVFIEGNDYCVGAWLQMLPLLFERILPFLMWNRACLYLPLLKLTVQIFTLCTNFRTRVDVGHPTAGVVSTAP